MNKEERDKIDRMCQPRGLAIYGSMGKLNAFAQSILCAHKLYGYQGKIYPISHRGDEVLGLKIYRSLQEINEPVDLASISVPTSKVPEVLTECLEHGVTGVTVHTSGFAETGQEGVVIQKKINSIAQKGLKIIGPNCFGIYCPKGGLTFLPGSDYPTKPGPVGIVCQSGGMANDVILEGVASGIRFSKVFSFGNGCDLDAVRLIEYLAEDDDTKYIAAYLEGIGDGRRFLEVIRQVSPRKPVVIWKGGLTPFGGRATMSHTASLGGEADIWKGALSQAGAIEVHGLEELMDTLSALCFLRKPGKSLAFMGGGGAIGVGFADLAYRLGLEVPVFSEETQKKLKEILPTPGAGFSNPVDMATPALPLEQVIPMAKEIADRESINVLILNSLMHAIDAMPKSICRIMGIKAPDSQCYFDVLLDTYKRMKEETGKDIIAVLENHAQRRNHIHIETEKLLRETRNRFQENGIPVFPTVERALTGIRNALKAGNRDVAQNFQPGKKPPILLYLNKN